MCCGGGSARPVPAREPYVDGCPQGRVTFTPDAYVIVQARGVDPCAVSMTGEGGQVANRQDVLRTLNQ